MTETHVLGRSHISVLLGKSYQTLWLNFMCLINLINISQFKGKSYQTKLVFSNSDLCHISPNYKLNVLVIFFSQCRKNCGIDLCRKFTSILGGLCWLHALSCHSRYAHFNYENKIGICSLSSWNELGQLSVPFMVSALHGLDKLCKGNLCVLICGCH